LVRLNRLEHSVVQFEKGFRTQSQQRGTLCAGKLQSRSVAPSARSS
jgi:hypothetical protein